jgi:hypothetical protein
MDVVIAVFLAFVIVGGLAAVAWMHWDSRGARRQLRELEQRQRPAE